MNDEQANLLAELFFIQI